MSQTVNMEGQPVSLKGSFPQIGDQVKDFSLVSQTLEDVDLQNFIGQRKILNIIASIDTGICAMSVRRFEQMSAQLHNTSVLCISADLPFAHARFTHRENLERVVMLSTLRDKQFKTDYGVDIQSGVLAGLCARAVIILDEQNKVLYSELVSDIIHEPDYQRAIAVLA
ncbi:thiol peroxidase [Neisseria sp. Ec49-e6-T10]|uniref:thiol peroxidase n=1 Tax=Neisseria sp. Ec49-e6-T10 TaxID=3140744 RepID=UPI003EBE9C07